MRLIATAILAAGLAACSPRQAAPPPVPAPAAPPPWAVDSLPSFVAGIRLGDSLPRVRAVLGAPEEERELQGGARELVYWPRGFVVVTTDDQGVALIALVNPAAPMLAGVRIGDPLSHLERQWGPWTRRAGRKVSYVAGRWGVIVMADTAVIPERVESITFGWTAPNRSKQLPGVVAP